MSAVVDLVVQELHTRGNVKFSEFLVISETRSLESISRKFVLTLNFHF